MRVALAVNYVTFDAVANLNDMERLVREASNSGAGEGGFGGAFVISPEGELIARKPLGERGLLLVDLHR